MTELTTYYQNVKRAVRQNLTLYFAAIIVLMMLTSVLLGPPFSRTVTTAGFTYRVDGWFWEKNWLMYLIILVSGLLAVIRGGAAGVKNFKALRNILYMGCDAKRLLRIADEGTRYVPYDIYKNQKQARNVARRQRRFFEQLYVEALLACGQVDVADLYMKNGWRSKRNALIYRQLSLNIQAHYAYQDKDAVRYRSIVEQGGRLLKRSTALWARLDWLEGRQEQAVERLKTTQPRVPYEQVMFAGLLSAYLREIGQVEEAREYADYVIEHGGTLALRETVMEDWT
ncbi:hypothetical protein [Laedolimicola intestinihominis]|uniref:Heme biosynthesis protein HemY n=1 Tax=Laedolimicola intestinihominis TaxID=3133166 RepID=A0ABV1FKU1_9FIRM